MNTLGTPMHDPYIEKLLRCAELFKEVFEDLDSYKAAHRSYSNATPSGLAPLVAGQPGNTPETDRPSAEDVQSSIPPNPNVPVPSQIDIARMPPSLLPPENNLPEHLIENGTEQSPHNYQG